MDIAFRARNVVISESLRRVTREKVIRVGALCGIERADVCFSVARNPRIAEREVCAITLFGSGHILRAEAAATEVSVAADRVVGNLEQRAHRLRGRLLGRRAFEGCRGPRGCRGARCPVCATAASAGSVHFPTNWSVGGSRPSAGHGGDAGEAAGMGITDAQSEPVTPEEAALEMGERDRDIFFFVNIETGRPAALRRRSDGDIALFDPSAFDPSAFDQSAFDGAAAEATI